MELLSPENGILIELIGGGGGSRMHRTENAKTSGSSFADENALAPATSSTPQLPTDVARACYALALAVLDGDHERARSLARMVLGIAIEQAAAFGS